MKRLLQKLRQRFKRSFVYAFVLCVIILLGGGWGFWAIDPAIDSLGDGVWLAFTTAATVGYGDLVPSTFASRLFAVAVFMLGLTALSLATSALTVALSKADGETAAPTNQTTPDVLLQEIQALQMQVRQLQTDLHSLQQGLLASQKATAQD
ncbi:MAG: hypothetical protein RLZZ464_789 [Pseudomonadota bacterium]|jgi:voltage-gated potassium channel